MGLDMYLTKKIYIGADDDYRNIKGIINITEGKNNKKIKINFNRVSEIIEELAYWRKANHIHKWFVDNIQDGEDDCASYNVSYKQLKKLISLCNACIDKINKPETLLPTQEGFFFGDTKYDISYYDELHHTINMLKDISENDNYEYRSSW